MTASFSRRAGAYVLGAFAFAVILAGTARVFGVAKEVSTSQDLVKEALHREIYGLHVDRNRLLEEALKQDPNCGPARWQRGFLQSAGKWVDVDALSQDGASQLVKDYSALRETIDDTVEGNMQIANWCRDKQLAMQERAHLSRILDLDPEHQAARSRLGFRQIAGEWVPESEVVAAATRQKKEAEASSRWRTELLDIRRDLRQADLKRQHAARDRLIKIQDVHAIPLMESLISLFSQEGSLAVIDAVGRLKGSEAVESLIRHAVFSQWPLARQAAAERLKERKQVSYVPIMLREMYMPLESRFELSRLPNGAIGYRHMFQREGQEEMQVLLLDTQYRRVRRLGGDGADTLMRVFVDSLTGMAQREIAVAQQNVTQSTYNERIAEALKIATYQDLPPDPNRWWKWWDDQNDMVRLDGKQTRSRYQLQEVAMADRPQFNSMGGIQSTPQRASPECFAAGTIVWTRTGGRPIETLRVGDVVLAQDPETGELAFKPVLRTTVRPEEALVKVCIGRDTFETSNGHLYWVAGHGWAKAKSLESGMTLHCLRGSIPVTSIEEGSKAETYNLIVADFHTYFVGQERVLSHDVTVHRPTEAIVPGLKDD